MNPTNPPAPPAPATLQALLENVQIGRQNALKIVEGFGGDEGTKALIIESRALQPEPPMIPVRRESPRRSHLFHEVNGFAEYLKKYGSSDTVIYGNPELGIVDAVINELDTDGFERVQFRPMLHPLWRPWENLLSQTPKLPLDTFVDFIIRNRRVIDEPDGKELVMLFSQMKASTTIELHRGRGKNSLNGLLLKTTIQGESKDQVMELPDSLVIGVPIFIRTAEKGIEIDLTIETGGDGRGIFVTLSTGDILAAKFDAFEELFHSLEELKKSKQLTITHGTPNWSDWDYVGDDQ